LRADEAARSRYVDLESEEDDPDMEEAIHQHDRSFNFSGGPVHGMRGVVALVQEVAQD